VTRTTWLLIGLAVSVAGCQTPRNQARVDSLPGGDVEFGQATESGSTVAASLAAGESALREGRLAEARQQLDAVIEQSPHHARAHHLAAVVADLEQRFGDAERHYHEALKSDPQKADILGDLGYSYFLQQRDDLAEQYLSQALQVDADHVTAKKNLALVVARRGDSFQARQLLADIMPPHDVDELLAQIAPPSQNPSPPQAAPNSETPLWALPPEMPLADATPPAPSSVPIAAPNGALPFDIVEAGHTESTDVAPAVPDQFPTAGVGGTMAAAEPQIAEPAPRNPDPLAAREWPPASWPAAQNAPSAMQRRASPATGETAQPNDVRVADDPWSSEAVTDVARDEALDPLESYHEYRRRNDPEYARLTEEASARSPSATWRP